LNKPIVNTVQQTQANQPHSSSLQQPALATTLRKVWRKERGQVLLILKRTQLFGGKNIF